MRISDWSSDVCSSDRLAREGGLAADEVAGALDGGGAGDVVGHVRLSGENYSSLLQRSTGNIQAIFAVQPKSGICKVASMELGDRIAHYRSKAGLNQSELERSEERRVGKEGVSKCSYRGSPAHSKHKNQTLRKIRTTDKN